MKSNREVIGFIKSAIIFANRAIEEMENGGIAIALADIVDDLESILLEIEE